jgi:diadenosine tetraphosphate (Ap4A) HIT family hydrolase
MRCVGGVRIVSSLTIRQKVDLAQTGSYAQVVARMKSGWAIMGDVQFLQGYCLLLADPVVENLNMLNKTKRQQFLMDMSLLGDAILKATGALRINYEMLGNLDQTLHAHLFPRSNDEEEHFRTKPAWFYDWNNAEQFDIEKHGALLNRIRQELEALTKSRK